MESEHKMEYWRLRKLRILFFSYFHRPRQKGYKEGRMKWVKFVLEYFISEGAWISNKI